MDEAQALTVPAVGSGRTQVYIDAIKKAAKTITDRPVFAGMICSFSLAARLLDVSDIMIDCYDDSDMVQLVLEKVRVMRKKKRSYQNSKKCPVGRMSI